MWQGRGTRFDLLGTDVLRLEVAGAGVSSCHELYVYLKGGERENCGSLGERGSLPFS